MIKTIALVAFLCVIGIFTGCENHVEGTLKDSRDGKVYKTIKIGSQTWMAENLNYKTEDSRCYDDKEENCKKYGLLYTWDDAIKACPVGWHLPSRKDYEMLYGFFGGLFATGKKLKSKSGWKNNGNGSDAYGFSALPAGERISFGKAKYGAEGDKAVFWTSTEYYVDCSYFMMLYSQSNSADMSWYMDKDNGFSVRCIMNNPDDEFIYPNELDSSLPLKGVAGDLLIDSRDGKTYRTVVIGEQIWMAENLNYEMEKSYCYKNKESNCSIFGRLYEWKSAMSACPTGWHLPRKKELETLIETAGGKSIAGKKLKSRIGWNNFGGSDEYGFSVLPGGHKSLTDLFWGRGGEADFWSYTSFKYKRSDSVAVDAYYLGFFYSGGVGLFHDYKYDARSVRCIKDVKSLLSPVTDYRDGRTYQTIAIGTQIWMMENLAYKMENSYCYDNKEDNCKANGRLYTWSAAEKACPIGWHLPSKDEFETLIKTAGPKAGKTQKSKSGQNKDGAANYGYSESPNRSNENAGFTERYWTSTKMSDSLVYFVFLNNGYEFAVMNLKEASFGLSVHCIKD